ncbi:hypothetical protein BV25DRAFT_1828302 [Artomyces pyxidatus]|uniref:Uncharacterized protein n=1 Tax=Artomyces pyxidatus TaxID=48021 RepID=A0ACB8SVG7_9AGAM|nr:hypothetical protein BV25DRAFT_1828302 [Artomyces pyxidatus]
MALPPSVDLQRHAGELAHCLSSMSLFLSAAEELLHTIRTLESEILTRQSRKIVTLVEIDPDSTRHVDSRGD